VKHTRISKTSVLYSYNEANQTHSNVFDKVLYLFRTSPLSIIGSMELIPSRPR